MKKILVICIGIIGLLPACRKLSSSPFVTKKTDTITLNYNDSYKEWVEIKNKSNNSYNYTLTTSSFSGFGSDTKITVQNGAITNRDFYVFTYSYTGNVAQKNISKEWHENTASLNTHSDKGGALMTLDDIYAKANNVWLKADPKLNYIYFETKNAGLISTCGYFPKDCQDDCFVGVHISSISFQ